MQGKSTFEDVNDVILDSVVHQKQEKPSERVLDLLKMFARSYDKKASLSESFTTICLN